MPTAEVCRRHGISSATFYKWESKFGGLEVSDARRLRRLEQDNSRLKKLLAEAMLDNVVLKNLASKKLVTPGAKREAVTHARKQHGLSERRACRLVGVSRRVIRYEPTRPHDGALRQRLRRELQRPPARRMPQRDAVHLAGPRAVCAGRLATRLQHSQTTLETGWEDPRRDRRRTCLGACPKTRCHPIKHQS